MDLRRLIRVTPMFFHSWSNLGRVLVVGVCAYAALVLMLRISGKRTLSKMNAFDFVVTIALGSTLASLLLSKDVALAEGLLALALLIGLQWFVAALSVRWGWWRKMTKSEPRLLAFRGELNKEALWDERITENEIYAALRSSGVASLQHVEAVILETDGRVSVIASTSERGDECALNAVRGLPKNKKDVGR